MQAEASVAQDGDPLGELRMSRSQAGASARSLPALDLFEQGGFLAVGAIEADVVGDEMRVVLLEPLDQTDELGERRGHFVEVLDGQGVRPS